MTTKEQERKALEKIRKIIIELGEDSYVGTAFEGCFEDAEDNIENDFAMSMKSRWQDAENRIKQYKTIRDGLVEDNKSLIEKINSKDSALNSLQEDCNYWREHCKEVQSSYHKEEARSEALENKIKEQEQQILELKAKLYDYMVKEAH